MDKNEVLLILIPGFPKDDQDSTCLPAQQRFILALNEFFPELKLIIFTFHYPYERKEYIWKTNSVISFGGRNRGGLSRLLLWNRVQKKFKQVRNEYILGGILSFWAGECSLVGKKNSVKYDLPFYCWIMGQDAKKQNHYVTRIQPAPGELIAISDFISSEFTRNHLLPPSNVIPLGIYRQNFMESRERYIDLLGVGSLITLKQFDLFINIVKDVTDLFPGIKAVICGKGPEEQRLRQLIEKNKLSANIELLGEQSYDQVLMLMNHTKIFLHPSSYEGFSGVCLEALAAGAHVISFTHPMKQEIRNWNTVDNAVQMKEKVFTLLGHQLEHIPVVPFTMEETVRKIMTLFK